MSRRIIQLSVLVLLLTCCGEAPPQMEADGPDESMSSFTTEDLFGIWGGPQEPGYFRFTEDGRYCLSWNRDELDTFPGDCGTFEFEDMVLTLTSDKGYCQGEIGSYSISLSVIGQLQK
jgi:hypothetical protein